MTTVCFYLDQDVDLEVFLEDYPQTVRQTEDDMLTVQVTVDDTLIGSLSVSELAEFFGIDEEFVIAMFSVDWPAHPVNSPPHPHEQSD